MDRGAGPGQVKGRQTEIVGEIAITLTEGISLVQKDLKGHFDCDVSSVDADSLIRQAQAP